MLGLHFDCKVEENPSGSFFFYKKTFEKGDVHRYLVVFSMVLLNKKLMQTMPSEII